MKTWSLILQHCYLWLTCFSRTKPQVAFVEFMCEQRVCHIALRKRLPTYYKYLIVGKLYRVTHLQRRQMLYNVSCTLHWKNCEECIFCVYPLTYCQSHWYIWSRLDTLELKCYVDKQMYEIWCSHDDEGVMSIVCSSLLQMKTLGSSNMLGNTCSITWCINLDLIKLLIMIEN